MYIGTIVQSKVSRIDTNEIVTPSKVLLSYYRLIYESFQITFRKYVVIDTFMYIVCIQYYSFSSFFGALRR